MVRMRKIFGLLMAITALVSISACEGEYTPKPKAYARIDLPVPTYISPDSSKWDCPYWFEFNQIAAITLDPRYQDSTCWYNLYYPKYHAVVHLTYNDLHENLSEHIEESRKLAMKHINKASKIDEILVENEQAKVYGIVYDFKGETASDLQFFLTDSTQHFLRGSLYFNVYPNKDSLGPVIEYVKHDIDHLMESFRWN